MPAGGFEAMVGRMLTHPRIDVALGTTYARAADRAHFRHLIYTGPIDAYYEYRYGRLPYRSLRFEFETVDRERVQPVGVINHPGAEPYTRVTEFKHLTGQVHPKTTIAREYSQSEGDPYYPIPNPDARALYGKYAARAAREANVTFVGRLAEYRYYNMDQVVASALAAVDRIATERVA
jgi:UDP-galactopyranose mutase